MCSHEGLAEVLPLEWWLLGHADETKGLQSLNQGCAGLLGSDGNVSLLAFASFPHQEM